MLIGAIKSTVGWGIKFILNMIGAAIVMAYILSGFGLLFSITLLEPLLILPVGHPIWMLCIVAEVVIVSSWIYFLKREIERRMRIEARRISSI
jgi:divalent metal cation (Fe/Co/Zn/Cd) transporter